MRAGGLIDPANEPVRASRRRRRGGRALLVISLFAGAAVVVLLTRGGADVDGASPSYDSPVDAIVERVVDGDTIVVQLDGVSERVRLLNIDTPESVAPGRPIECLGIAASDYVVRLLPAGTPVTLEFDRELRDRYDRLLAGVVTADGVLVNAEIARAGFAEALEVGGNDRFTPQVEAAVSEARDAGVGLWAPGAC